jgi:predicted oxidoreductase (fatty acid repression mutant protein)
MTEFASAACSRQARRTHYALAAESTLSDEELLEVVQKAVKHTPTAFNSQSARAVLVLGDKHRQLWDVIFEGYRQTLADDSASDYQKQHKALSSQAVG